MKEYGVEVDPEECEHEWMPYELGAIKTGGGLGATQATAFQIYKAICPRCGKLKSLYEMARRKEFEKEMEKLHQQKNKK
ncbi:hypothetical protein [Methanonatronarchaeum sp. AMET-Sl]|uniref:hypothetical protein n=1 Tax=Methanonatronarchaeum sp. AMET-Sl TaxID=3037654 RepID=UPI00244DC58D|nr:hypothetical protein [Methanonatronarchaeum sp. AMET-Sl]WGI18083.1 hypothetical protein QEN48_03525 [Methanonatronarchaeum sp. AMET-Sl]